MYGGLVSCCDPLMLIFIKRVALAWLIGWCDLFFYGSVPGYETRGWLERKRLDHIALCSLFSASDARCAALLLTAVQILVLSLAWHFDLDGWRRDLLRATPALFVLPWFATARKVAIESILQNLDR